MLISKLCAFLRSGVVAQQGHVRIPEKWRCCPAEARLPPAWSSGGARGAGAPPKNFSTIDEAREELKVEKGHSPLFHVPVFAPAW